MSAASIENKKLSICLLPNIIESSNSLEETLEHNPIGLLILAQIISEAGHQVRMYDVNHHINATSIGLYDEDIFDQIADELIELNFNVYGFSTIADGFPYQVLLAKRVKERDPSKVVLFGGPQATVYDIELMKEFSFIDFILRGESENTILPLIDYIADSDSIFPESIKGLTYRKGGAVIKNQDADVFKNLDELPPIAYNMVDFSGLDSFQIEVGRGCPFTCTFCSSCTFFKRRFRMKSVERIFSEVDYLQKEYNVDFLGFIHDLFTFNRDYITTFCETLIESGRNLTWSCSARADCLDNDIINLL